jgi:hypothetical protein
VTGETAGAENDIGPSANDRGDELVVISRVVFEVGVLDDDERRGDRLQSGAYRGALSTIGLVVLDDHALV